MKRIVFILFGLMLMSIASIVSAQVMMPDFVIRTAQEINAIYGDGTLDINNTAWDWRGGSIGDGFVLTTGCANPITLPAATTATGYYRVFFDTNFDSIDEWVVVVYSDYSYFGLCTAPRYECGSLQARLVEDERGHVSPKGLPANLRAQPGESSQSIGEIPPSGEFTVLDGPRCASGVSYWLVDYNGSQGWTAEGYGQAYWLVAGGLPSVISVNSTPINPTPVLASTAIPTYSCASVTSRLYVGLTAQVTPGLPNNLRASPGQSGDYVGEIPSGIPFQIIGGPQCNSDLLWWQVNYQGTLGWIAEASSSDDYWLEPVVINTLTPINTDTVTNLASVVTLNPQVSMSPSTVFINQRNDIIGVSAQVLLKATPFGNSWSAPLTSQLTTPPLATRIDSNGQVISLVASQTSLVRRRLDDEFFIDEFYLLQDNVPLDVAAFHPDDGKMLVISKRGQGLIFADANPESASYGGLTQASRFMAPDEIYTQLKFSDNGQQLVGLTNRSNLIVWSGTGSNPATWTARNVIIASDGVVIHDVAISPDGRKLLVAGLRNAPNSADTQGFYTIYDLTADEPQKANTTYFSFGVPVRAVEFTPDGTMFAIASRQNEIAFVDMATYNLIHFVGTSQQATDIVFNDEATLMATAFETGIVTVWRIN